MGVDDDVLELLKEGGVIIDEAAGLGAVEDDGRHALLGTTLGHLLGIVDVFVARLVVGWKWRVADGLGALGAGDGPIGCLPRRLAC